MDCSQTNDEFATAVMTALRDPDVFHFGDLLLSARAQLGEVSEFMPLLEVLSIFAFGTLSDLSDFQREILLQ
jgi:hypothetical protein